MFRVMWNVRRSLPVSSFFFFNDTATTEIYTLSLHDALPIYVQDALLRCSNLIYQPPSVPAPSRVRSSRRSEEHTSELQSQSNLVCRLLLEKKKKSNLPAALISHRYRLCTRHLTLLYLSTQIC